MTIQFNTFYIGVVAFLLLINNVQSQDLQGLNSSQHLPLQNLAHQPAELISSKYNWNINILSLNIFTSNRFLFEDSEIFDNLAKFGIPDLKFLLGNQESVIDTWAKLQLPSISYKISEKSAIAFSSNIRANALHRATNDNIIRLLNGEPISIEQGSDDGIMKSIVNSWIEFNLSYAHTLINTDKYQINGGATLKLLNGSASGYINLDDVQLVMNENEKAIDYFAVDFSYALNNTLKTLVESEEYKISSNRGIGFDISTTLMVKNAQFKNTPYRYKFGISITDIGQITQKRSPAQKAFKLSGTNISADRFKGISTIKELSDTLVSVFDIDKTSNRDFKTKLRTNFRINGDYQFSENWFMHIDYVFVKNTYNNLVPNLTSGAWGLTYTPRFENQSWGVFSPISYSTNYKWNWGIAARYKWFYMGSGKLLSNIISPEKSQNNFYFGINLYFN